MIQSFKCEETRKLFSHRKSAAFILIERVALRKLYMLDAATSLLDLQVPPGNRLEKLKGDREGQHSIRINDQFRICFVWIGTDATNVEIVDYH